VVTVNQTGEEFLADPGFTLDKHSHVSFRCPARKVHRLEHFRTFANNFDFIFFDPGSSRDLHALASWRGTPGCSLTGQDENGAARFPPRLEEFDALDPQLPRDCFGKLTVSHFRFHGEQFPPDHEILLPP